MEFELGAGGNRNRLAGGIIHGGAKAPGGNDNLGALQGFANDFGDARSIISNCLGAVKVYPQAAQSLGDETGISIGSLAEQEFGSDGNNLCGCHV